MSAIGSGQASGTGTSMASPELTPIGTQPANRHSLDGTKLFQESAAASAEATPNSAMSPAISNILASPPKLQQSFSANDVPTLKSSNGQSTSNNHAQQHFQNHNVGLGRIPAGAMTARHTRELSGDTGLTNGRDNGGYPSISSTLHANAAPFGPVATSQQTSAAINAGLTSTAPAMPYPYYPPGPNFASPGNNAGYGNLPMMMQNMSVGNNNPAAMYAPQNYTGYGAVYNTAGSPRQPQDSQARVIQSRRAMDGEAMSRFNNLPLEQVVGTIYSLCKDQHGCRYLQKKLDDRNEEQIHMIWLETNQHVIELMTDPFGNYLCQKLLELCSEDERTVLIRNATSDMVRIALNAHGTRALQKMIDSVSSPVQINLIIEALRNRVVELIQDLNGNHVIQKCLNKLNATDASFIFDAVGQNCVEVGTHRHGCCVLQRCIDHADGAKKTWLIERITANAVTLVQDPFGNYVVQYIIDLNEPSFTEPLVGQFLGRIPQLSKHKFSSNVVEKCLRCSSPNSKDKIVSEIMAQNEIKQLMQDSYGNYVVQTALDYATPSMKHQLVEAIRPHLPAVRATPYGRRIQAKVQTYDNQTQSGANTSGQATPTDSASGQIPLRPAQHNRAMSNNTSIANGINGGNGRPMGTVFPASNMITVPPPGSQQPTQQVIQTPQNSTPQQQLPPAGAATENSQNWV
ncbi:armadillo-type protein [Sordaria brevicollis]|uniref:Armadillo-type protein n=1 Tax=Sordaria brevicollis TaxID=83679 RepID=A0AAE0UAV9_SORBR|nr:armadillo-type protein [Sordaria brevicollis]